MKIFSFLFLLLVFCFCPFITNAQSSVWVAYFGKGKDAYEKGDFQAAEKFLRVALTEAENAAKNREENTDGMICDTVGSLSIVLSERGKYAEAEEFARRAVKLADVVYKESDVAYAIALNNLGLILSNQKKFVEAEEIHRRAMRLREKYDTRPYRNLMGSILNLGLVYFEQDKFTEAEALFDRAKKLFNDFEPNELERGDFDILLKILNNLALTYEKQNRLSEAESSFQGIIILAEEIKGKNNSFLIPYLESYARVLRASKKALLATKIENRLKLLKGK